MSYMKVLAIADMNQGGEALRGRIRKLDEKITDYDMSCGQCAISRELCHLCPTRFWRDEINQQRLELLRMSHRVWALRTNKALATAGSRQRVS